jgi:hypothetical protein
MRDGRGRFRKLTKLEREWGEVLGRRPDEWEEEDEDEELFVLGGADCS